MQFVISSRDASNFFVRHGPTGLVNFLLMIVMKLISSIYDQI